MCRRMWDDIITVEDDDLVGVFLDMVENHKMIVENSGLLTVAALKQLDVKNKKIVCILSGGNMDVITMSSVVQHGLIQRDRIFSLSVLLPDKPGELVRVGERCGQCPGQCHQAGAQPVCQHQPPTRPVELRITLEAFGTEHKTPDHGRLWRKRDTSQGRSAPSCIKKRSCIHRPYCRRGDPAFAVWLFLFYILVDTSCIIVYNYTRTPDSGTRTDGALDLKER